MLEVETEDDWASSRIRRGSNRWSSKWISMAKEKRDTKETSPTSSTMPGYQQSPRTGQLWQPGGALPVASVAVNVDVVMLFLSGAQATVAQRLFGKDVPRKTWWRSDREVRLICTEVSGFGAQSCEKFFERLQHLSVSHGLSIVPVSRVRMQRRNQKQKRCPEGGLSDSELRVSSVRRSFSWYLPPEIKVSVSANRSFTLAARASLGTLVEHNSSFEMLLEHKVEASAFPMQAQIQLKMRMHLVNALICCPLRLRSPRWGPPILTAIWSSPLGPGCPLPIGAPCWGPATPTAVCSLQWRSGAAYCDLQHKVAEDAGEDDVMV